MRSLRRIRHEERNVQTGYCSFEKSFSGTLSKNCRNVENRRKKQKERDWKKMESKKVMNGSHP